jgi:hypothetical protein
MKNLLIIIVISISFVSLLNTNAQIIGLTEPYDYYFFIPFIILINTLIIYIKRSYIIVAPKVVRYIELLNKYFLIINF